MLCVWRLCSVRGVFSPMQNKACTHGYNTCQTAACSPAVFQHKFPHPEQILHWNVQLSVCIYRSGALINTTSTCSLCQVIFHHQVHHQGECSLRMWYCPVLLIYPFNSDTRPWQLLPHEQHMQQHLLFKKSHWSVLNRLMTLRRPLGRHLFQRQNSLFVVLHNLSSQSLQIYRSHHLHYHKGSSVDTRRSLPSSNEDLCPLPNHSAFHISMYTAGCPAPAYGACWA